MLEVKNIHLLIVFVQNAIVFKWEVHERFKGFEPRGCRVMPSVALGAKLVLKIIPLRSIRRRGRQRVCKIQRSAPGIQGA